MASADEWINTILKRSAELRKAGILSIGCDGNSAVLAPAEPDVVDDKDSKVKEEPGDPVDHWENPASYPTGRVPTLGDIDEKLPEIPTFGDD